MSDILLARLARAVGINMDWTDAFGNHHRVTAESQRAILEELGFPAGGAQQITDSLRHLENVRQTAPPPPLVTHTEGQPLALTHQFNAGTAYKLTLENGEAAAGKLDGSGSLPPLPRGYHRLQIDDLQMTLAIAPRACPSVDTLVNQQNARLWGITAQLYSLRRKGDCGLGDTGALEILARQIAAKGADALAISPVHAMFSADSNNYSPYSPSTRLFFNILHSAPDLVLGRDAVSRAIRQCHLQPEMERLEALDLIDWPAASALKQRLLRQLYTSLASENGALANDLTAFVRQGGETLFQHCCFEALHAAMLELHKSGDWRQWPDDLRNPHSRAVAKFAADHRDEINFQGFAQWLMVRSLERAQQAARDAGMRIGLISDLAVGAHGGGSQTWTHQEEFLPSVSVGAPPDLLNGQGQNWGISAFSPSGMRRHGFRAFIEMLRANLAYSGGMRIDHVMGLKRLWVIPANSSPDQGAYLDYPFEDQMRLLALESWRHHALVVGEDLGTVPPGLRDQLASHNILGTRVLLFEQEDNRFHPAATWSGDALATTTTHDLPSITGWFQGRDLDWRQKALHSSIEQTENDRQQRATEKSALLSALQQGGHLHESDDSANARLAASIEFIGSTPAPLALVPLEDLMGTEEQPNLPGPGDIHPNWRRRWAMGVEDILSEPQVESRVQCLAKARQASRNAAHE
ncbi:MAG: 4-alpha-glucanotransferase [Porticoccaceae bacterium]